jgi:hypothetical protein
VAAANDIQQTPDIEWLRCLFLKLF